MTGYTQEMREGRVFMKISMIAKRVRIICTINKRVGFVICNSSTSLRF